MHLWGASNEFRQRMCFERNVNVKLLTTTGWEKCRYKAAVYPLTGALLGTCLAGPIGLLAGLKVGAAAAFGGTVLGFTGGRVLKSLHEKRDEDSGPSLPQRCRTNRAQAEQSERSATQPNRSNSAVCWKPFQPNLRNWNDLRHYK